MSYRSKTSLGRRVNRAAALSLLVVPSFYGDVMRPSSQGKSTVDASSSNPVGQIDDSSLTPNDVADQQNYDQPLRPHNSITRRFKAISGMLLGSFTIGANITFSTSTTNGRAKASPTTLGARD